MQEPYAEARHAAELASSLAYRLWYECDDKDPSDPTNHMAYRVYQHVQRQEDAAIRNWAASDECRYRSPSHADIVRIYALFSIDF